jgi:hypothetical protein
MGGQVTARITREGPGSDGALPYHRARFPALPRFGVTRHGIWPTNSIEESWGVTSQGRITREAPVRTEPHPTTARGFPRCLVSASPAMELADQFDRRIMGGHVTRQDNLGSPGSDGASPHHPRGFPPCPACDVTRHGIADQLTEESMGGTSQGRITREAPAQAELRPTCAGFLASTFIILALIRL